MCCGAGNAVLEFVLTSLPIGLHIPCDMLGGLWGKKTTFRKRLYAEAMANLLAQLGVYISEVNGRGRLKGSCCSARARPSRSTPATSRWARRATWSAWAAPNGRRFSILNK